MIGLLALMLLHESRRGARTSPTGDMILLNDQDRSLWNRDYVTEGLALVERALLSRRFGAYTIQAAIAVVHAEAAGPPIRTGHKSSDRTILLARGAVSDCGTEPRRGRCDARRPRRRGQTHRRHSRP